MHLRASSSWLIRSLRDILVGTIALIVSATTRMYPRPFCCCPLQGFHIQAWFMSLCTFFYSRWRRREKTDRKESIDSGRYAIASQPPNVNLMLHQTGKKWCFLAISLQVGPMDGNWILIKFPRFIMSIFNPQATFTK